MGKILIIEDEPAILLGLKDELSLSYTVLTAICGKDGLRLAEKEQPNLILLDLRLPDIDGFIICQEMKERGVDSAIIMLTARDQVVDKVRGFELGADDYVTKPFSLEELKARINAVMRRKTLSSAQEYRDNNLRIDFKKYTAAKKNKPLKLSPLEFKILRFLISRKGQITSRQDLLEQVWGYSIPPLTRTVDAHILTLRKKIGRKYIQTIHKEGYKFEAKKGSE